MAEVGQVLRQKRLELGLSLEDIQVKTKIRKRYIEAIESEDWSVLPGQVYARGFVRSYADALGLDGFELLSELDKQQVGDDDAPVSTKNHTVEDREANANTVQKSDDTTVRHSVNTREARNQQPGVSDAPMREQEPAAKSPARTLSKNPEPARSTLRRRGGGGSVPLGQITTVVVGLAILGGGWWFLYHRGGNSASTISPPAGNQVQTSVPGNTTGSSTPANTVVNKPKTPPKPVLTVSSKPYDSKTTTQTYIVTTNKKLKVTMKAAPQCWMRIIKLDGKSGNPSGKMIQPKQPQSWTASNLVAIRLGHVQGVTLTVDGKQVKLPNVNYPVTVQFKKSTKA